MYTFVVIMRGIFALPAMLIGLLLRFAAVILNLAAFVIERIAVAAAGLLASGITLLLLLMLLIGEKELITSNWIVWIAMYVCAGILYILPNVIDYVISGVSAASDWLMQILPWKG